VVYWDFPLNRLHPQASKAHEAARCADAQGQFWAYHDQLYTHAPQASPEQLTAYAREVGLDIAGFEQCISSGRHQDAVQQDIAEGTLLGVTGTPAFFVNSRLLVGAQPIAKFVELIEEELSEAQTRKSYGPQMFQQLLLEGHTR
jgi:protein-disulfide isomerase